MKRQNPDTSFRRFTHEDVKTFIETQLDSWPLAKKNYDALRSVVRKPLQLGSLAGAVQCNPARIVSTGAAVDTASIAKRPCFLCRKNRPAEQMAIPIMPDWEMLVNPYPILPVHLTIVSTAHRPQDDVPYDIVTMAEKLPGMSVFFNGARAGASCPDHKHLQAVLADELPLLRHVENNFKSSKSRLVYGWGIDPGIPIGFLTGIVRPDALGESVLMYGLVLGGKGDREFANLFPTDQTLCNKFFWIDKDGCFRFIVVPRKAHRPACYYADGDARMLISPGCIDVAGLIVAPRREDFDRLTSEKAAAILEEVTEHPA